MIGIVLIKALTIERGTACIDRPNNHTPIELKKSLLRTSLKTSNLLTKYFQDL